MLKRVISVTIFFTVVLITWGGVVHNTQSSLACPDWPLCFGQYFPEMKGGVFIEHGHRLLASLVGFLTLFIFIMSLKGSLWKASLFSLILVIFQAVLGGLTVIYKLPPLISTLHLGTALLFLCSLIYLKAQLDTPNNLLSKKSRNLVFGCGLLIYVQAIIGGYLRHLGGGAACGLGKKFSVLCMRSDFGLTWWPNNSLAQGHMVHRYFAVFLSILVVTLMIRLVREAGFHRKFLYPVILIFTQILLGVASVSTFIGPLPTTLHLTGAALLLMSLWSLFITTGKDEAALRKVKDIIGLTKPRLSSLVLLTVYCGMFLVDSATAWSFKGMVTLLVISPIVLGACALNCYLERDVDQKMKRTQTRGLPSGRLGATTALVFGLLLIISSFIGMIVYVNLLTALLGLLAAVLYLLVYTPLKKYGQWALYVGAIPGAIPPVMGITAMEGKLSIIAISLFVILFFWQIPHFLSIALFHQKDYARADLPVLPNIVSINSVKWLVVFFTILLWLSSLLPYGPGRYNEDFLFWTSLLGFLFCTLSLWGLFWTKTTLWARMYFYGSLFYLPAMLGLLVVFR